MAFGAAYVLFGGGVVATPMLVATMRLGHAGKMQVLTWLVVIGAFVACLFVKPSLNPDHPLKVYYGQTFVAATNESYAHVKIPTGVAPFVDGVLPLNIGMDGCRGARRSALGPHCMCPSHPRATCLDMQTPTGSRSSRTGPTTATTRSARSSRSARQPSRPHPR
jgi:hypothetical protein